MQSFRLLAVAVLVATLALSSTQNAYAVTELSYDDGVETTAYACPFQDEWRAVKFVFSDFGLSSRAHLWKLLMARFYQSTVETAHDQLELHVLNSDGSRDLAGSTPVTFTTNNGWNNVDLSGQNIIVSGDFWIAYKWLGQFQAPCLALDYSAPDGRSFSGIPGSWSVDHTYDYMIRAEVNPSGTYELCVIQLGVGEPNGDVSWLPGYAYVDIPISQCQNKTEYYTDVLGRTIVIHQFNQTRIYY